MNKQVSVFRWFCLILPLVVVLVSCSPAPEAMPAAADPEDSMVSPESAVERCGDRSRLSRTVNFYNWTEYIDPEILTMFEEECGVRIVYDTFASNEELLAKLQAGASGYDLIVPSDYMVSIMRELDLLRELDHNSLPNLANISERFADAPYDPGYRYSVPYQWGTTGIGYDADIVDPAPDGWTALFDPAQVEANAGKISLLNDAREVLGAALKYLGYSVNSTDPDELAEAKALILAVKPDIATFDSESYEDLLVGGETVLAHGWSGDMFQAIYANESRNLDYVIPREGGVIYTDNLAIPKGAPNPYTAEVLINYLLDAEIGAMITNFTYYASPNEAAFPLIADEIKEDARIFPPEETLARLEFVRDVGETTQLYERIWTEIKAGE